MAPCDCSVYQQCARESLVVKETLKILNELEREGLYRRYAIGGAIGALFYMDPFETEDLDILILLPENGAASLAPLAGIYEALRRRGFEEDGPFVVVHGVPVQFLVAYNPLAEEAVAEAREVDYDAVATRVPTPEHLAALMVDTGRVRDRARLEQLRDQVDLDMGKLRDIIRRHGLETRFLQWTRA
jgi:hypothetical protein